MALLLHGLHHHHRHHHPSRPASSPTIVHHPSPFVSFLLPRNPRYEAPSRFPKTHLLLGSSPPPLLPRIPSSDIYRFCPIRIFELNRQLSVDTIGDDGEEDLGPEGEIFQKTLRLVECAMLASVAGLIYILSNSLAIENYFGCFFSLPIVISSMRWDLAAGRKTMVATAMLLLTLSGPVKATTYLLMHGFVGFAMGSLWRLRVGWSLSILFCTMVRSLGAIGYVLLSSFLIRENILNLITINIHASLMGVLAAVGVNTMLTMNTIYTIFTVLLLINSGCFVFLLHILYGAFLSKLGLKDSLSLPKWLQGAL